MSKKTKNKIDKCCLTCGFLCKLRYSVYSELSDKEREGICNNKSNVLSLIKGSEFVDTQRLACYKAQLPTQQAHAAWKQGAINISLSELNKKQCAFYFPYEQSKELTLTAIDDKYKQTQSVIGISISKKALIVAIISMIVSILAVLVSLFK